MSRVCRAKLANPANELVGEELVRVREEHYFVLPESDEEDPDRDERMGGGGIQRALMGINGH